jgi:AcrR family transcriptional regulator
MPRTVNPARQEERRRQILEAALACFRRRGFHATTIAEICAEAQVSAGALYRYFASKEDIIDAIGANEADRAALAFSLIRQAPDPVAGMLELVDSFVCKCCSGEDVPILAELVAEAARNARVGDRMRTVLAGVVEDFAATLADGQRRGHFEPGTDPLIAARALMALVDGLALSLTLDPSADNEALSRRILHDAVLRYLVPTRAAAQHHPPMPQRPASTLRLATDSSVKVKP